jgi:ribose/xylose/arabinose/galactoside ABC-type transport system permease subunit
MKEMSINESVGFKKRFSTISKEYAILFAIIGLGLVFSLSTEYFLTQKNITNILLQSTALSIVAAGQGMVILSGEFDLSLGQVACLTSCTAAYMMKMMFINPWLAIAVALLLGMGLGAANGVMVAYFKCPLS